MPAWLLTLLVKVALPLVLSYLEKQGYISAAEALGVKTGTHVLTAVQTIKTYPEYPGDDQKLPPATSNINQGEVDDGKTIQPVG